MALGKENEVLAISLEADGVNSIISNSVADALPQPVE